MPLAGRHRRVDVLERLADAPCGVVERDVVLERIGARDVVVVAVLPAPDDAAGLVVLARDRLELDLDPAVAQLAVRLHAPGKGRRSRLTQHLAPARGVGVRLDRPLRTASTGGSAGPARRRLTDDVRCERAGLSHGLRPTRSRVRRTGCISSSTPRHSSAVMTTSPSARPSAPPLASRRCRRAGSGRRGPGLASEARWRVRPRGHRRNRPRFPCPWGRPRAQASTAAGSRQLAPGINASSFSNIPARRTSSTSASASSSGPAPKGSLAPCTAT